MNFTHLLPPSPSSPPSSLSSPLLLSHLTSHSGTSSLTPQSDATGENWPRVLPLLEKLTVLICSLSEGEGKEEVVDGLSGRGGEKVVWCDG